jgi:hypothetical protein
MGRLTVKPNKFALPNLMSQIGKEAHSVVEKDGPKLDSRGDCRIRDRDSRSGVSRSASIKPVRIARAAALTSSNEI